MGEQEAQLPTSLFSRLKFLIEVKPDSYYRLSGFIKTIEVKEGLGANLCIESLDNDNKPLNLHSEPVTETSDWKKVEIIFNSGKEKAIFIMPRLGWYGEPSAGAAFFDDLLLEAY